jgi:Zn-dependent protease with chaperone function
MKAEWYYPIITFIFLLVYLFVWTKGESLIGILISSIIITLFVTFISLWINRKK